MIRSMYTAVGRMQFFFFRQLDQSLLLNRENRCIVLYYFHYYLGVFIRRGRDIVYAPGRDKRTRIVSSSTFIARKNIYEIINALFRSDRELFTFLRFDSRFFPLRKKKKPMTVFRCARSSHRIRYLYYILYTLYGETATVPVALSYKQQHD